MKPFFNLIVTLVFNQAIGQESIPTPTENNLRKNTIYATGGSIIFVAYGGISYERMLLDGGENASSSFWINASVGYFSSWGFSGPAYNLRGTYLTGTGKDHFEISLGGYAVFDKLGYSSNVSNANHFGESTPSKLDNTYFSPGGSIGYRLQKPYSNFIFRTGVGYPETVYISLGTCF